MHLHAQGLLETIFGTKTNRQKDRLALFAMLAAIREIFVSNWISRSRQR